MTRWISLLVRMSYFLVQQTHWFRHSDFSCYFIKFFFNFNFFSQKFVDCMIILFFIGFYWFYNIYLALEDIGLNRLYFLTNYRERKPLGTAVHTVTPAERLSFKQKLFILLLYLCDKLEIYDVSFLLVNSLFLLHISSHFKKILFHELKLSFIILLKFLKRTILAGSNQLDDGVDRKKI